MNCKDCKYCKQIGCTNIVKKAGLSGGRALYFCEHPEAKQMKDKSGYLLNTFIGYGDGTFENTLKLKTRKKWCPIKEEK